MFAFGRINTCNSAITMAAPGMRSPWPPSRRPSVLSAAEVVNLSNAKRCDAFDHPLGRGHLGLTQRGRGLDVDDHGVTQIDQVVGAIGEEGLPAAGARPARRRSAGEMNFGVTSVAAPNAASSSTARYSSTARLDISDAKPWAPSTPFWRLASALIRLPSTAKPSPPTRPLQCSGAPAPSRTHALP
jgi:hypothetical protein